MTYGIAKLALICVIVGAFMAATMKIWAPVVQAYSALSQ